MENRSSLMRNYLQMASFFELGETFNQYESMILWWFAIVPGCV